MKDFEKQRINLRDHPLLQEISLENSFQLLEKMELERFASNIYSKPISRPLIQPRGGFSLWKDQFELTKSLVSSGADFIPLTIDSHTRQNDYERAKILLERFLAMTLYLYLILCLASFLQKKHKTI